MQHYEKSTGKITFLALLLTVSFILLAIPVTSEQSDGASMLECNGLQIVSFDNIEETSAGGSLSCLFTLTNSNTSGNISVNIDTDRCGSPLYISSSDDDFTIKAGDYYQVHLSINADRYADPGDYSLIITFKIYNHGTSTADSCTVPIDITVKSLYLSDGSFNKIMGVFENNLPYPFNTPTASAIITALIWFGIACLVFMVLHTLTGRYFDEDEKDERREIKIRVGSLILIIITTFGIVEAAKVYGANQFIMQSIRDISVFVYAILGSYIVWDLYKNIVKHVFHDMEEDGKIEGADTSLIPLFNMIGEIIIGVVTAAILLSLLGMNLIGILTGAGIVGVAISLGAQNTLSEMFSGITLLATRPFREGDMVRIGNDENVYEVIKVRLMNSEFKNWATLEHMILPNSSVSNSKISNMTKGSMAYRLFLYYDVGYDSDLDEVKKILLETANQHPQIIKDGSFDKPGTRVTSFDESTIQVRLAVYIFDFRDNVTVTDELITQGYKNLEDNGIDIPYERRDIYIKLTKNEE